MVLSNDKACELELKQAWEVYRQACYGNAKLPERQLKEVRQAFLSGIHWLNSKENYDPDENLRVLRSLLGM